MKIMVIPTTDWIRHPVPNRLNFIFDILAEDNNVYVLHFALKRFSGLPARATKCHLVPASWVQAEDPSLYYALNFPYHIWKIRRAVKDLKIDVILSTNILPSFAANLSGVPIVFDYLDHLEESASIYYPGTALGEIVKVVVRLITRFNLRHARSVITINEELSEYLRGIGVKDITEIINGVDTSLLKPVPMDEAKGSLGLKGTVLGYVGSLEHWVDLETVVSSLPRLDATLLVVGPGLFTDYGDKLKMMAEELGVAGRVVFTGAVEYAALSRYISAMDIGINPLKKMKKNEVAIGGKVFNYLSCGRPVLSSRMIALERFLGDEIYYYDDEDSFVQQVESILDQLRRGQVSAERNRSIAERYDWRSLAGQYEAAIKRAVD